MKTLTIKTNAGDYSAENLTKEDFFKQLEAKDANGFVSVKLGNGTAYKNGIEYSDDAVLHFDPQHVKILIVEEHDLSEKETVELTSK